MASAGGPMNTMPGLVAGAREGGVLGQEAVAGVDGLGARLLGDLEDLLHLQVALGGRARGRAGTPRRRAATWGASRSGSEYTATLPTPSSSSVRMTRMAISPRLATRTFENMRAGGYAEHNETVKRAAASIAPRWSWHAPARRPRPPCASSAAAGYGFSCARLCGAARPLGLAPGRVSLLVKRVRAQRRPRPGATLRARGRPRPVGHRRLRGRRRGPALPGLPQPRPDRLRPARHRAVGPAALPGAGAGQPARTPAAPPAACARGLGRAARLLHDARHGRRHRGDPARAGHRANRPLRHVVRDEGRARVRAALPDQRGALVLDSVVEADGPDPLYRDTLAAVPRVLRALCRSGCRRVHRRPGADLARAGAPAGGRAAARPGGGRARPPPPGPALAGRVVHRAAGGRLRPEPAGGLPGRRARGPRRRPRAAAAPAAAGPCPLDGVPPPPRSLSTALYAATTCEEVRLPWARSTPPDRSERRRQAAERGRWRCRSPPSRLRPRTTLDNDLLRLCEGWPAAPAAPEIGPGPAAGRARAAARGRGRPAHARRERGASGRRSFRQARLLVAPATGHSALGSDASGCAERAFSRFFAGRPLSTRCRAPARRSRPAPPPPRRLSAVAPARGARGLRGRALRALALTLKRRVRRLADPLILDETDPDLARGGGLRGGRYRLDGEAAWSCRRMEFVPGVQVSGSIKRFSERRESGRLHVFGRATPDGVLRLRGDVVSGRLGGRRVRVRLSPSVVVSRARRAAAASLPGPPR